MSRPDSPNSMRPETSHFLQWLTTSGEVDLDTLAAEAIEEKVEGSTADDLEAVDAMATPEEQLVDRLHYIVLGRLPRPSGPNPLRSLIDDPLMTAMNKIEFELVAREILRRAEEAKPAC